VKVSKEGPYRKDKESKYYLYKSKYKYVPMTAYQAMKVNSLLGQSLNPNHLLSPRQLQIFEKTNKKAPTVSPDYEDIYTSWEW
jgi:hypothetical protein